MWQVRRLHRLISAAFAWLGNSEVLPDLTRYMVNKPSFKSGTINNVGTKQAHLEALIFDELLDAVHHKHLAPLINTRNISREKPPVFVHRVCRLLRLVEITWWARAKVRHAAGA